VRAGARPGKQLISSAIHTVHAYRFIRPRPLIGKTGPREIRFNGGNNPRREVPPWFIGKDLLFNGIVLKPAPLLLFPPSGRTAK
jgi:hypothetical protein